MRGKRLVLAVVFACALAAPVFAAPADDIAALITQAETALDAQPADAEATAREALDLAEQEYGAEHVITAHLHGLLGDALYNQDRFAEAEPHYREAAAVREKLLGTYDADTGQSINDIAISLRRQERYVEAVPFYRKAIDIRETVLGLSATKTLSTVEGLARTLWSLGEIAESEQLYRRLLAAREATDGPDSPTVADVLRWIGRAASAQERNAEAEIVFKRVLAISEAQLGPDHVLTGFDLIALGQLYSGQERFDEARPLLERAVDVLAQYEDGGTSVNAARVALSFLERATGHLDRAIDLTEQTLAAAIESRGPKSREVADITYALGTYTRDSGDLDGGDRLVSQARDLYREIAPTSRSYYRITSELGRIREQQGRYDEALALHRETFDAMVARFGPDSADVQPALSDLGNTLFATGDYAGAAVNFERATAIVERLAAVDAATVFASRTGDVEDQATARGRVFDSLVKSYFRLPGASEKAFLVAQRVIQSEAAQALAQMAARQASGDGELATLVRERQDLVAQWQHEDAALTVALAQSADTAELRKTLAATDAQIAAVDAKLATGFPDFADLQRPTPLDVATVQSRLAENEVLLFYADTGRIGDTEPETFLWVIPSSGPAQWLRVPRATNALAAAVRAFRESMGVGGKTRGPKPLIANTSDDRKQKVLTAARELYTALLGEAEPMIANRELIIVPSRSLASLPFHALVRPAITAAADPYRGARWLAREHAITILPSVASLTAPDAPAVVPAGTRTPYIAFADPVLTGGPLPPLPETADEARAIAAAFGADGSAIHLQAAATESMVKHLSADGTIARASILHFATHGLVPGDLPGLTEPAIVLTPPGTTVTDDDGLLTASEVTTLKLDADWVILSACNTASSDGGGETLSGLARAFFYAGARTLMVSHWPVNSDSAVRLASGTVSALAADPTMSRAEALRRAMATEIEEGGERADPANWAPFIVVGR
jgi:CHAT domain-containing protein/tetratricopeptide (TPR) repeat protein